MNIAIPGELLNALSGGGLSNEARLRLLEKRLVGHDVVNSDVRQVALAAAGIQFVQAQENAAAEPCNGSNSISHDQAANPAALQPGSQAPRQPLKPVQGAVAPERAHKRKRNSSPLEQRPQAPMPIPSPGGMGPQDLQPRWDTGPAQQQPPAASTPSRAAMLPGSTPAVPSGAQARAAPRTALKTGAPPARNSGGAAGGNSAMKTIGTGQTTLNAYYPVVDGSSRDSDLSHGLSAGPCPQQQQQQQQALQRNCHTSPFRGGAQDGLRSTGAAGSRQQNQPPLPPGSAERTGVGEGTVGHGSLTPSRSRAVSNAGPVAGTGLRHASSAPLAAIPETGTLQTPGEQARMQELAAQARHLAEQLAARDKQLVEMQQQLRQCSAAADRRANELTAEASAALARAQGLATELTRARQASEERDAKVRSELTRIICSAAKDKHDLSRMQLASAAARLGNIAVQRNGLALQEVWEDGQAAAVLAARQAALTAQREEVEAARKALRKKLAPPPSAARAAAAAAGVAYTAASGSGPEGPYMDGLEFVTQDEIYRMRLAALKREEDVVKEDSERLAADKARYVRTLKRQRDEDGSRFECGTTVLGGRFVLLSMLGKGGFSEVFKAYDLRELRVVAAKVHQLNPGWSEARKASYVKHAIREVDIQKALRHPHIVGLVDILEVDAHCFATVLDYCEGGDLDTMLREHSLLPEKEARSIISQVMAGLFYLNQPGRRIIHYDLKPANILFDGLGLAKITDFGLSKVVEEGATMGMELTSQGAGTYWYLPPECFEIGGPHAPKITNKVDVWSVGVIFYQMLFGRRPYGEGLSQEQIMRDRVVLGAREVEFPTKPSVSAEAKEFMRRCLALRAVDRWDVAAAAADPYLSGNRKAGAGNGAGAAGRAE